MSSDRTLAERLPDKMSWVGLCTYLKNNVEVDMCDFCDKTYLRILTASKM